MVFGVRCVHAHLVDQVAIVLDQAAKLASSTLEACGGSSKGMLVWGGSPRGVLESPSAALERLQRAHVL
eukprot:14836120-Alexandrium_andersonii.AAC.1